MKKIFLLGFATLALSCNCQKKAVAINSDSKISVTNECPPKGACKIEIVRNKSIAMKKSDIGSMYYELVESDMTHVVKYEFNKGNEELVPDSSYREEVVFEISAKDPAIEVSGKELSGVNAFFGRFCFCKGQTGYYRIQTGNLKITPDNGQHKLSFDFTVPEVPQLTKQITSVIK